MEKLTKEEQERLGLYTGRFQALWDNYFWAKEQIEHRKNTIRIGFYSRRKNKDERVYGVG